MIFRAATALHISLYLLGAERSGQEALHGAI